MNNHISYIWTYCTHFVSITQTTHKIEYYPNSQRDPNLQRGMPSWFPDCSMDANTGIEDPGIDDFLTEAMA